MGKDGGIFVSEGALAVLCDEGHGVNLRFAGAMGNERMIKLIKARLLKIFDYSLCVFSLGCENL